jgi:hypothetical protein
VRNSAIDPDLRAPRSNVVSATFERELLPNLSVSATGIYKRTKNIVAFWNEGAIYEPLTIRDELGNRDIQVWNQINPTSENFYVVTNPPMYKQKYRGLVLALRKRRSQNWHLTASLTISRSDGIGATSTTRQGNTSLPRADFIRDRNMLVNNEGPLQGDRTYMLKVVGGYELPYGINAAVNYTHQTGAPFARTIYLTEIDQPPLSILAEPRGSLRFESQDLLDVRLEKSIDLGGKARIGVLADIFNLLNKGTPLDVITTRGTSSNYLVPRRIINPLRAQIGLRVEF